VLPEAKAAALDEIEVCPLCHLFTTLLMKQKKIEDVPVQWLQQSIQVSGCG
jgi:hypothetical protein